MLCYSAVRATALYLSVTSWSLSKRLNEFNESSWILASAYPTFGWKGIRVCPEIRVLLSVESGLEVCPKL